MKIDIARQLGAVTRTVKHLEHEGRPAHSVIATRSYDTSIDDLWDAITNPERIPRWFLPVSGEFRLGGRFQLEGNAGGEIQRCEPPRDLAVTWEFGGEVSWVFVRLESEAEERTLLTLEHLAHEDDHWHKFGPGAAGVGWDGALSGLDLHITTGEGVKPEEAMAWMTSEEGKSFYRQSSEAWGQADIDCGADPAAANERAASTAAFYTGTGDASEEG